jgi:hypothetical protein
MTLAGDTGGHREGRCGASTGGVSHKKDGLTARALILYIALFLYISLLGAGRPRLLQTTSGA